MDYLRAESKSAEESKVEAKPADANVGSPAFEDYQPNFAESWEVSSDEEDNSNLNEEKQAETTPFEKSDVHQPQTFTTSDFTTLSILECDIHHP